MGGHTFCKGMRVRAGAPAVRRRAGASRAHAPRRGGGPRPDPAGVCRGVSAESPAESQESADASAEAAYDKRKQESEAAGVASAKRPPKGGDPPPEGDQWGWTLNWDYVGDHIIVGSCPRRPEDVDRLVEEANVEAILCLQSDVCFDAMDIDAGGVRLRAAQRGVFWTRVACRDFDKNDQAAMLPEAVRMLGSLVRAGRRTYVHCTAGINRASLTTVGFLTWVAGMSFEDALAEVREARPQANPYEECWRVCRQRMLLGRGDDVFYRARMRADEFANRPSKNGNDDGAAEDGSEFGKRWDLQYHAAEDILIREMFHRRIEADVQVWESISATHMCAAGGCAVDPDTLPFTAKLRTLPADFGQPDKADS